MKRRVRKLTQSLSVLLCLAPVSLTCAADQYGFDWESISREMGVQLDEQDYLAMQREMALGLHPYEIYINNHHFSEETLEIVPSETNEDELVAQLPARIFQLLNIKRSMAPELFALNPETLIGNLSAYLPGVTYELDTDMQSLYITVPQIYEDTRQRVLLPPTLWNFGEPALRIGYDLDASQSEVAGGHSRRAFGNFTTQVNVGAWRFHSRSSASYDGDSPVKWRSFENYFTRVVASHRARFRIGEFSTNSRYIGGLPIIGAEFIQDDAQVEPSEKTYLPVIRGFANSEALVTISQAGQVLRERTVVPGPFEFSDIQGVGSSGDIEVEIVETNGKRTHFTVPYALSGRLLKTGRLYWSSALGRYYTRHAEDNPALLQLSAGYGMPGGWTLYGGTLVSEDFSHFLSGVVLDAGRWGNLSGQWEMTEQSIPTRKKGQTLEVAWNKHFDWTNTDFNATYRHTFSGRLGAITDVIGEANHFSHDLSAEDFIKDRYSLNLSQNFGDFGSISGSLLYEKSHLKESSKSVNASWSIPISGCQFEVQAQQSLEKSPLYGQDNDWQVMARLTVPLAYLFKTGMGSNLGFTHTHDKSGLDRSHLDGNFSWGQDNQWQAGFSMDKAKREQMGFNVNLGYEADWGRVSTSYSQSEGSKTLSAYMSGGLLITAQDVLLRDSVQGNLMIVSVPGASTARVNTDARQSGERLLTTATQSYTQNTVILDPDSLPANVTVLGGIEKKVVPADDAVIRVEFEILKGQQAYLSLQKADGTPLPYGALVNFEGAPKELEPSVTDDDGSAYFSSIPQQGTLLARWRDDQGLQSCRMSYRLPENLPEGFDIVQIPLRCDNLDTTGQEVIDEEKP